MLRLLLSFHRIQNHKHTFESFKQKSVVTAVQLPIQLMVDSHRSGPPSPHHHHHAVIEQQWNAVSLDMLPRGTAAVLVHRKSDDATAQRRRVRGVARHSVHAAMMPTQARATGRTNRTVTNARHQLHKPACPDDAADRVSVSPSVRSGRHRIQRIYALVGGSAS